MLADSNLDWGQDLPALSRLLQQHPADRVYLAYFGTADPLRHGIEAVRLPGFGQFTSPAAAPPKNGERAIVAISTNLLLGLHVAPPGLYSWVWELPQLGRAGKSIHVYDCSGPTARAFLAATFWQVGDWSQLVREMREATTPMRSKIIDVIRTTPQYQRVKGPLLLAEILARAGDLSGAEFELLTAVDVAGQQVEALYKLALLYRQTARRGEAMEAIDRALQLEPSTEQRRLLETLRREMTTG